MAVADCTRECRYCGKSFVRKSKGEPTQYCNHDCRRAEVRRRDREYCKKPRDISRLPMCSAHGCDTRSVSKGLCFKHYFRARRHGDPTVSMRGRRIERPCGWCGEAMSLKPASDQKYCSRSCSSKGTQSAAGKSVGGLMRHCQGCGNEFHIPKASWSKGLYCTRACSDKARRLVSDEVDALRRIAVAARRKPKVMRKANEAGSGARHVPCTICSTVFERPRFMWPHRAVCSDACRIQREAMNREAWKRTDKALACRRAARQRRRAKERGAEAESIDWLRVFERDKWRCHICLKKTHKSKRGTRHPRAPELDHIITLADGGSHTWGNVACACSECNSKKGATSLGQLGLPMAA